MNLKYKNDNFKILQITDTQDGTKISPDTLRLINAAMERVEPDLVVFTGDQIWGKSKFKGNKSLVENSLKTILSPVTSRNTPFTFCFGNHDQQVGVSKEEQYKIYKSVKNCIADNVENIDGVANHVIEVKDDNKIVFLIYMIDSGTSLNIGYDHVHENQIEWYKSTRDKYEKENGAVIPSLVFQHIPVCEVMDLLTECTKHTKGSVQGFRTHANKWYILNKEKVNKNGFMKESPADPQENSGEFEAFKEKGEVFGVYFGHDHINSFYGKVDGIDIGYTQGAGFHVYGPGLDRGVRVFEIPKDNPKKYITYDLKYRDLCGKKVSESLRYHLISIAPTNVYDAIYSIVKIFAAIGIVSIFIILILFFLG